MTEVSSVSSAEKDNPEKSSVIPELTYALLSPNESYNSELALSEREQKWRFTLSDLQCATKVVSRLFRDPSLFIGDPYLADSRLYVMITRDRKTKRENREVYKTIMNEEKNRRKKYERMRDAEAIGRTGMKRERIEALNVLTLKDVDSDSSPLLLCGDQCPQGSSAQSVGPEDVTLNDPTKINEPCNEKVNQTDDKELTTTEIDLLRLIGAFENLLRLEQVLRSEPIGPTSTSPSSPPNASTGSSPLNETAARSKVESPDGALPTFTKVNGPCPRCENTQCQCCDPFLSPSGAGEVAMVVCPPRASTPVGPEAVDYVAATQLTAQVLSLPSPWLWLPNAPCALSGPHATRPVPQGTMPLHQRV